MRRAGLVSRAPLVEWEKQGVLKSVASDPRRGKLYRSSDVDQFVIARNIQRYTKAKARGKAQVTQPDPSVRGATTADVFKAFADGKDIREIVIRLRVPPQVVRELYAEWCISLEDGEATRRQREADARASKQLEAVERQQREIMHMMRAFGQRGASPAPAPVPPDPTEPTT
ncbi:MAG: hypothetical protein Q8S13_09925 [Dehalococcoidia bacterium]|nr:hypothetical protein [Dehalococcoidia bacterium]